MTKSSGALSASLLLLFHALLYTPFADLGFKRIAGNVRPLLPRGGNVSWDSGHRFATHSPRSLHA